MKSKINYLIPPTCSNNKNDILVHSIHSNQVKLFEINQKPREQNKATKKLETSVPPKIRRDPKEVRS